MNSRAMEQDKKNIGIYICTGCGIGDSIDIDTLKKQICSDNISANKCKDHPFLCSDEGCALIHGDIQTQQLDHIIIAACSPRVNQDVFNFSGGILERVNLREQLSWCMKPGDEHTQLLAEDMIRMSIAKVNSVSIPQPYIKDNLSSAILIIGGGISGITSALEAAKAGYEVYLVEKENKLGGWTSKWSRLFPEEYPYDNLKKPEIIDEKIRELEQFRNIHVFPESILESVSGEPGQFKITVRNNQNHHQIIAGAIILATGWKPYDASKLEEYNYGQSEKIITQIEFEEYLNKDTINHNSDLKKIKNIVFIQCAGSRDEKHLPYCSNTCCPTTLKQARQLRDMNKDVNIYIIYKDIRTPGKTEFFYQELQKDEQIFFTKGDLRQIDIHDKNLNVIIDHTLLGESIRINADLVVLATGMIPSDSSELNLEYRQGKGLPDLKYGFPDSHFICFPYETRRTGIYSTGCIRAPQTIQMCIEDSTGAVLKAIQCIECTRRGESIHPRSGDKSYPVLYLQRCTDCKRCTEECPFGAYDENEKGTPLPNPARCRRCGICMGSCPERIINFDDYSIHMVSSMIKSLTIPDEFEGKPRILVFLCENDAYPAFDMAGLKRLEYSPFIRIIPVRCIGSVNQVWLSDALSHGYDGILQIGCKPGEDYQCHFITGSELTKTRGENIQETLRTMMLEPERIRTEFLEINEYDRIPDIINDYLHTIETIGPNPFKGM